MKMLCFKFHRNRAINEEFDLWEGQIHSGDPKGGRGTRFEKKIDKASYTTGVLTHTENFSILGDIESVKKSGKQILLLGSFKALQEGQRVRFRKFEKASYRTVVRTYSQNFSTSSIRKS